MKWQGKLKTRVTVTFTVRSKIGLRQLDLLYTVTTTYTKHFSKINQLKLIFTVCYKINVFEL